MLEPQQLSTCPLYRLSSAHALADVLGASLGDLQRLSRSPRNYVAFDTCTGGKQRRVTAPLFRLDEVHCQLADYLRRMGQPDYLHSGIRHRSHVTHATSHAGSAWLCKIDLRSFFLQVRQKAIWRYFHDGLECSSDAAALLTRLCTVDGHLPVGGRISQPLSFLVTRPMFDDVNALATARFVRFTAYVDDLCFSGDGATPKFLWDVKQLIHKHGLRYHADKCYAPGQDRLVAGVLLTASGVTIPQREARKIERELHALKCADLQALTLMQGRLAAAANIDVRYLHPLRAVQARINNLRH